MTPSSISLKPSPSPSNNGLTISSLPPLKRPSLSQPHLVPSISLLSQKAHKQSTNIEEKKKSKLIKHPTKGVREGEMMLGKRQKPHVRRTTSMSEFYLDEVLADVDESLQSENQNHHMPEPHPAWMRHMGPGSSMLSPRGNTHRRNSADYASMEAASFLKACGLCKRRLAPGHDIFMYRGEIAYCSMECRQQQMNQDELREKCVLKSMSRATNAGSDKSSNGETMAAA